MQTRNLAGKKAKINKPNPPHNTEQIQNGKTAFFKLADTGILDQEDAKEGRLQDLDEDAEDGSDGSDDEDINMFEDIPSDEEDKARMQNLRKLITIN